MFRNKNLGLDIWLGDRMGAQHGVLGLIDPQQKKKKKPKT
jgi:hypothetical protein